MAHDSHMQHYSLQISDTSYTIADESMKMNGIEDLSKEINSTSLQIQVDR